jgi:RNA polymerase sigma-70 factor (ECF subfamily)
MDDELRPVRAMARRDPTAWGVMYERHVREVFGLVYYLVGSDRCDAEEICQEAWLIAIERFDGFDPRRGNFRDWLLGIARHRALRRHRRTTSPIPDNRPDEPTDALPPLELREEFERADVVRAALLCLDDDHRQVLLDKYVSGLSVAKTACQDGAIGQGRRIPALAGPIATPGPVASLLLDPDRRPAA